MSITPPEPTPTPNPIPPNPESPPGPLETPSPIEEPPPPPPPDEAPERDPEQEDKRQKLKPALVVANGDPSIPAGVSPTTASPAGDVCEDALSKKCSPRHTYCIHAICARSHSARSASKEL